MFKQGMGLVVGATLVFATIGCQIEVRDDNDKGGGSHHSGDGHTHDAGDGHTHDAGDGHTHDAGGGHGESAGNDAGGGEASAAGLSATGSHLDRDAYAALGLDHGALGWATGARASSSMGGSVKPEFACGQPNYYPRHGSRPKTVWAPKSTNSAEDWIEFTFAPREAKRVLLFETLEPGCVWRVEVNGQSVYTKAPSKGFHKTFNQKAQVFQLELSQAVEVESVRVYVSPLKSGNVRMGYDAIALD